jgi:hypothetical protein
MTAAKGLGGMLRDWTFTADLEHKAARIKLRMLPQWIVGNLDADDVAQAADLTRKYTSIKPFLTFRDVTASAKAGDMWEEVDKYVTMYRGRLQSNALLKHWAKRCIQRVLSDERTVAVDGEKRLNAVTLGAKVRDSPYRLGGYPTFCFPYKQFDRSATVQETHHMAVGTIVNGSGYLVLVSCDREDELTAYVSDSLMPNMAQADKCRLDVDVSYADCPHATLLQQQELFGALRYFDRSAAVEFTLPMHPMHIRPDHSPLQSAGFGSLACLTLDLEVFQKLYDDAEGSSTANTGSGSSGLRYKPNSVVLYVEVEDLVKLGFPPVMSVDQYAALKTKKLMSTFTDTRVVGAPLSLPLGQRVGRATTCTFTYEAELPMAGSSGLGGRTQRRTTAMTVKAIIVTTLVGNHGATAVYFTKLGQAIFDSHLYIFQHLIRTLRFFSERELVGTFTKEQAQRVRLTENDIPQAYPAAQERNDKAKTLLKKHMDAIRASTDGETENATVVVVKVSEDEGAAADGSDGKRDGAKFELHPEDLVDTGSTISVRDIPHLADLEDVVGLETPPADGIPGDQSPAGDTDDEKAKLAEIDGGIAPEEGDAEDNEPAAQSPNQGDLSGQPAAPMSPDGSPLEDNQPAAADADGADASFDEERANALYEEVKRRDDDAAQGPALRNLYKKLCEDEDARPNSYLMKKLPDDPRFTNGIEDLDMSFNYIGHAGFRAILRLLHHMPRLRAVHFNSMSLDNADVEELCKVLATNKTIRAVHLRNNARVSLPSSPHLLRLLRTNRRIVILAVSGSSMSSELVAKIESTATANKTLAKQPPRPAQQPGADSTASNTAGQTASAPVEVVG